MLGSVVSVGTTECIGVGFEDGLVDGAAVGSSDGLELGAGLTVGKSLVWMLGV